MQLDGLAVDRHRLAGEEVADGGDDLGERRDRRLRAGADLLHPCPHAVADAALDPTGGEAGKRRQLHRRRRRVAREGRQDADADGEAFGVGQGRRRQGDAGRVEAVLDHPQLVDAAGFEPFGELDDERRFQLARKADAETGGSGHRAIMAVGRHSSYREPVMQ